jgi:hypothetical protein
VEAGFLSMSFALVAHRARRIPDEQVLRGKSTGVIVRVLLFRLLGGPDLTSDPFISRRSETSPFDLEHGAVAASTLTLTSLPVREDLISRTGFSSSVSASRRRFPGTLLEAISMPRVSGSLQAFTISVLSSSSISLLRSSP